MWRVSTARYTTPYPPTPRTSTSSREPPSMRVPTGGWMGEASAAEVFEDIEGPDDERTEDKVC